MALHIDMYRVQLHTKSRVSTDFPKLEVRVDEELSFTPQTWGAVLDGRELFTSRVADGKTIRVPRDAMLPVYETSLEDKTHKVLLGIIPVPTMYVCSFASVPLWLALANGAHDMEEFRADMRAYKPQIKSSWPVSFYQLQVKDLIPPRE